MAESKNTRVDVFENYSIPRAVFTLSLPTIAGSLVSLAYSMADTYFVGLLNDPVQTAAVTRQVQSLLYSLRRDWDSLEKQKERLEQEREALLAQETPPDALEEVLA